MIIAKKISRKPFIYSPETKTLVQELSSLPEGYQSCIFSRVYDDSCDIGFTMLNEKTGGECTFSLSSTDKQGEDIYGWNFIPIPESVRKNKNCKELKVLIIND